MARNLVKCGCVVPETGLYTRVRPTHAHHCIVHSGLKSFILCFDDWVTTTDEGWLAQWGRM